MDLMNRVFHPYLDEFVVVFIDNILIYYKSREEHAEYLCTVLNTLANHKIYTKSKKCDFWMEKVHFLDHIISKDGISVDLAKVATAESRPRATNITEVRSFLGMAGYYCKYVKDFSQIALPLT